MRTNYLTSFLILAFILAPVGAFAQDKAPKEEATRLETVVVTATKTKHKLEDVPVSTILISRDDIENSNAKTVSGLLAEVPGFNFSQQSDLVGAMGYKNTVRGLNAESKYMLILVDGQRVHTGFHSGGMAGAGFAHNVNVIPVNLIDHIEIVQGPGSALYGSDAMVGVLNIITKMPTEEFEGSAGASYGQYVVSGKDYMGTTPERATRQTHEAHATIGGPISDRVQGTMSVSHEANDGIHPTKYDVTQTYIHTQLQFNATKALTLRGGAEITNWEERGKGNGDQKTEQAPRLWAVADYVFNPDHSLTLKGYYQKLSADFKDPLYSGQNADVSYQDAELQYTGRFFDSHVVTAGLEFLRESLDTGKVPNKSIRTTSVYLQDEWSMFDDTFVLVPGVRMDDNSDYGTEVNPKLSAMYKLTPATRFRGSAGWSFKAPSAQQTSASLISHGPMWVESNPSLNPEKAFTWQLGVEQDLFEKMITVGLTYYNMSIKDMIVTTSTGRLIGGNPVMSFENKNKADIQGIEFMADIQIIDPLHLQLSYAYTNAKDADTKQRLVDTPENAFSAQLDYTNADYRFGGNLSVSYTSDQTNTDYGLPNASLRTKSYTTTGLKIWKDFLEGGRVSLEVDNLFDNPLIGSDTIYARRTIMTRLEYAF